MHSYANVRICDEDGNFKYSMEVKNYEEALKFFQVCQESEIPITCRKEGKEDCEAWIEDIDVQFGNDGMMFSINLYCEILSN